MRFSHIELTNFRSFGPGTTRIELPEDENLLATVGANNAGKSNLQDAFRLALGQLRNYDPQPADFHNRDVTQELRITLHLREHLLRETIFRGEGRVSAFFFRSWQATRNPDRGQLKTENYCLDAKGETYVPPAAIPKRNKQVSAEAEPVTARPLTARQAAAQLGPVHYLDPDLYRAFNTTGSGALARLLDIYREDFRSESNTYVIQTSGETVPRIEAFERLAKVMAEILESDKLQDIEAAISRNLGRLLRPGATGAEVSIALPPVDELLRTALRLQVQDEEASPTLPVERLGTGYRSLLRVAIVQSYAELTEDDRKAVFLIEEPEVYLNPHLRRYFRAALGELAEAGHDVVLTTHDPAFASLAEYRTVLRLAKDGPTTKAYRCTESLDFSYEALARKLRRDGNAEVLFATKAVLCEGQDDVAVVRVFLERDEFDPDSRSVSIVDCGGQQNLPDYIRLLDALDIGVLVVMDGDASKALNDAGKARQVQTIRDLANERLFAFAEDLEAGFGTEKQRDNTAHMIEVAEGVDLDQLDEQDERRLMYKAVRDFVMSG